MAYCALIALIVNMVLLRKIILVLVSIFIEIHSATFDDSISFHVYPQWV